MENLIFYLIGANSTQFTGSNVNPITLTGGRPVEAVQYSTLNGPFNFSFANKGKIIDVNVSNKLDSPPYYAGLVTLGSIVQNQSLTLILTYNSRINSQIYTAFALYKKGQFESYAILPAGTAPGIIIPTKKGQLIISYDNDLCYIYLEPAIRFITPMSYFPWIGNAPTGAAYASDDTYIYATSPGYGIYKYDNFSFNLLDINDSPSGLTPFAAIGTNLLYYDNINTIYFVAPSGVVISEFNIDGAPQGLSAFFFDELNFLYAQYYNGGTQKYELYCCLQFNTATQIKNPSDPATMVKNMTLNGYLNWRR